MRNHLIFGHYPHELRYDVYEVTYNRLLTGKWEKSTYYSGHLGFSTGASEGWWFISSDDSIKWFLGPRVRDAMKELRRRYMREQRRSRR